MKKKLIVAIFIFCSSCFGGSANTGKVKSYKPGWVMTQKSSYRVGLLSDDWKREKLGRYKSLLLYNSKAKASLESDAFCDASFDDASLQTLTTHLHFDLKNKKIISQKELKLDSRSALHTVAQGSVDGVNFVLDTVVIKKDNCLFDFALVVPPENYEGVKKEFEGFYSGFHFEGSLP
ncbi:MAG: hypothetical protein HQM15_00860 [Deltaproteobacteria bacterium]|nr:hypothetical protein [Deltaproteobacteria bacterium]